MGGGYKMPRHLRQQSPSDVYHFINRGINKRRLFRANSDCQSYYDCLLEFRDKFRLEILHYCFMRNHTHLLIKSPDLPSLTRFAHALHRKYAKLYSKRHELEGVVFHPRSKQLCVAKEDYFSECGRYIERNPVNAGIVNNAEQYIWSSYRFYAYGREDELVTPSPVYEGLHPERNIKQELYRFYVSQPRDSEKMNLTLYLNVKRDRVLSY